MIDQSCAPGISGSGGTLITPLPQAQLASCPVYDPANWTRRDESNEPRYDVACYIYAIDWPNAGLADIHEVGDIYAYKQPARQANVRKKSKGHLDTLLEQNALPGHQLTHGLIEIAVSSQTSLAALAPRQGCYLIALAFWFDPDGPDHHWYRLDNNGYWSHKPGQTQVRNADSSGQLIRDPRLANLRPYAFCCFYYVPVATLRQSIKEPVDAFDASSDEDEDEDQEEPDSNDNEKKS